MSQKRLVVEILPDNTLDWLTGAAYEPAMDTAWLSPDVTLLVDTAVIIQVQEVS